METNIIYNEDCLEGLKKLPDKCIDLVVTDPPYEIDMHGGGEFIKQRQGWQNDMVNSGFIGGFNSEILKECERVLKKMNAYFFCSRAQLPMYLDFIRGGGYVFDILIWQKTNPIPLFNNHYMIDKEFIVFVRDKNLGFRAENYESARTIFTYPINAKDKKRYGHPTIKPLPIVETLIRNSSKEEDIVLDPFIGSGTTAVACLNTNRQYIGYEWNERFFEIAQNRVQEKDYQLF